MWNMMSSAHSIDVFTANIGQSVWFSRDWGLRVDRVWDQCPCDNSLKCWGKFTYSVHSSWSVGLQEIGIWTAEGTVKVGLKLWAKQRVREGWGEVLRNREQWQRETERDSRQTWGKRWTYFVNLGGDKARLISSVQEHFSVISNHLLWIRLIYIRAWIITLY